MFFFIQGFDLILIIFYFFIFLIREGVCDRKPNCDPKSKYRTYDGTCNNLKVTNHGKSSFLIENILKGL